MTKQQYEQLKRAARRDAKADKFGIGFARKGDYAMLYSTFCGYEVSNSPINGRRTDLYEYVRACRRLAQLNPGTTAEQLADARAFREDYKR